MSQRIFLHVGSPKTGTTFLQQLLWGNRDALRDQGFLLPGANISDHFRACLDVREEAHKRKDQHAIHGAWGKLVDQMAAWDGDAIISHELFAPASADQAEQAIAKLGAAEVHVVVTARDLARQIPAEWQEHIKHRSTVTFPDFVDAVRQHGPQARWFWRVQGVADVLDRWGHSLPRDRVHVITVPPANADVGGLWERFTGLVGIDGHGFEATDSRSNTSLRAEQAELVRRLNGQLGSRLPFPGPYPEFVKSLLAQQILAGRPGTKFGLASDDLDYAVQASKRMVARLERLEVDVVGDLGELIPTKSPGDLAPGDASVTTESVLDEAVEALAVLLDRYAEKTRSQRRYQRTGTGRPQSRLEEVEEERDRLLHDLQYRPVRHLLIGQSLRRPWLWKLRTRYHGTVGALRERFRR